MTILRHGFSAFRNISILVLVGFLFLAIFIPIIQAQIDSDSDGLSDNQEIQMHTDPNDADSDDDGVLDGDEVNWNKDTDGKGGINALDHDSDDDGIFDGTEVGKIHDDLTNDTDLTKNHFIPDADEGLTNTSMVHRDTDGDCIHDGEEDINKNGRIDSDLNETDPNFPDRDGDMIPDYEDDDMDGDGMYNEFESQFGLDNCDPTDADEDWDSDGFSNLIEYLGFDGKPGNSDWTSPFDNLDNPNKEPIVFFKFSNITFKANQTILFDEILFNVSDSEEDIKAGLYYTWIWADGSIDKDTIYAPGSYNISHKYNTSGNFNLILFVEDQHGSINSSSLELNITHPEKSDEPPDDNEDKTKDGKSSKDEFKMPIYSLAGILIIIAIIIIFIIIFGMAQYIKQQKRKDH